ncbi:acyl-CoA dehydrogenase family protein [Streptomyces sp. XD-27]|uniref:acyl-CoA dehydrogenase family protein n=1 Tax=Streptomyces sp. XD-27 TaxID=3062779 RepID=UPI0026F42035|nr:acyl-CoA dehydrogenase family protein [Streptomyces sp. XD-27]WKX68749.1 acyl-CoA dehydrogenase family protein [Streptomyces sp. XD-27]
MSAPDLLYSEAEEDLRAAVRSLLDHRCPPSAALAAAESGRPYDERLWQALSAMGVAGLLVPEALGGQGGTARETAVVLEELGRAAAPVPFLTSAVLAAEALLGCDTAQPAVREALAALAAGESVVALALPFSTGPDTAPYTGPDAGPGAGAEAGPHAGLPATVAADADGTLRGRVTGVAGAAGADVLLVPTDDGLYAVDAAADGVRITPATSLDLTRPIAAVTFDRAAGRRLADTARSRTAVGRALLTGAGLLASEQLGIAEWCLAETVRHTTQRTQFGRPVGSFQALKHRMAALWLELVTARATARHAADALATGSDAPVAVSVAQAYAAQAAVHAAHECVQLHGGIGMTWEHPAHLYLKRAKSAEIALGTPGRHRARLADLVGLPAPTS